MSHEPYRGEPDVVTEDANVAEMAAKGLRRIGKAARPPKQPEADHDLRVDIGRYCYRRLPLFSILASPLPILAYAVFTHGLAVHTNTLVGTICMSTSIGLAVFRGFAGWIPIKASRRRVERERAWPRSLPFVLDGYLPSLEAKPEIYPCQLLVEVEWCSPSTAASQTLLGLIGLFDPKATIVSDAAAHVCLRSAELDVTWSIQGGGVLPHNEEIIAYVHRLVGALLKLHKSHPVARVSIRRDYEQGRLRWDRLYGLPT